MASETGHIASANRTHETIAHLLEKQDINAPWIATAAFYKALHIVEAAFANDRRIGHTSDHGRREGKLKTTQKYRHIYTNYSPLSRASIVARYLSPHVVFENYLSPEQIVDKLLRHYLNQVEKSSRQFLKSPDDLRSIMDIF